jgi:hypothetical protein
MQYQQPTMPAVTRRYAAAIRNLGDTNRTGYYGPVCELIRCLDPVATQLLSHYFDLSIHVVRISTHSPYIPLVCISVQFLCSPNSLPIPNVWDLKN